MRTLPKFASILVLALPVTGCMLTGCMTSNLIHWIQDEPSIYHEPRGEVSRGTIKPLFTVIGFPIAVAWDIATFPFQILGGAHPYGDRVMTPEKGADL